MIINQRQKRLDQSEQTFYRSLSFEKKCFLSSKYAKLYSLKEIIIENVRPRSGLL